MKAGIPIDIAIILAGYCACGSLGCCQWVLLECILFSRSMCLCKVCLSEVWC